MDELEAGTYRGHIGDQVSVGHSCPGQQTLEGVAVEEVEEAKVRVANALWKWTS